MGGEKSMNKYNPGIHHRRSIRLRGYDYSQEGLYFVTICVQNRECIFGEIVDDEMRLNEIGEIVRFEWLKTANLRPNVHLHDFIVMPNHFHGILEIVYPENADRRGVARNALTTTTCNAPTENIRPYSRIAEIEKNEYMSSISPKSHEMGTIVRAFKSAVTKNIHIVGYDFAWQRNYHEHIIRDDDNYIRIADYIAHNPENWNTDRFYNQH
jgi:REP element-mobilizing transposase RayT